MNTMSRLSASALAFSFVIGACAGSRGASVRCESVMSSNRVEILATLKRGELKGSLILTWSLKNVSQKDVVFRDTQVLRDYSIFVKDQRGQLLSPTEKGKKILFAVGWVSHRTSRTLHPGEELVKEIVLSDIYHFRIGSVYTIFVRRKITAEDGRKVEEVRANPVRTKIE
jgi:hypothetical protein